MTRLELCEALATEYAKKASVLNLKFDLSNFSSAIDIQFPTLFLIHRFVLLKSKNIPLSITICVSNPLIFSSFLEDLY